MTLYDLYEVNCNWLPTSEIRLCVMQKETITGVIEDLASLKKYGNYNIVSFTNDFVIVQK